MEFEDFKRVVEMITKSGMIYIPKKMMKKTLK